MLILTKAASRLVRENALYSFSLLQQKQVNSKVPSTQKHMKHNKLEMWANAQRDGRPAEHRWRPLFNAAKFG